MAKCTLPIGWQWVKATIRCESMAGETPGLEGYPLAATDELPRYRTLQTVADRGVVTITLNRPDQRNAIGDGMRDELADAGGG